MSRTLTALVAALAAALVAGCDVPDGTAPARRVHDGDSVLAAPSRTDLARQLALLQRESGIDARVWIASRISGPLEPLATYLFASQRIAAHSPRERGLLVVYDAAGGRLRLETGYGLEAYLPDGLLGDVLERHATALSELDPALAMRLALRILRHRIRVARLEGHFDPRPTAGAPSPFRSGGGGAGTTARRASARAAADVRLAAGARPVLTHEAYLRWLEAADFDPDAPLFTAESRRFLARWPVTPAYRSFVLEMEAHRTFATLERGDLAVLFATDDPFVAPHFFRRVGDVWQMDLVAEVDAVVNVDGGTHSWSLRDGPFARAFETELVAVGRTVRFRNGDNRPAPVYAASPGAGGARP